MATHKNYIPGNMAEFNNWFLNLHHYVGQKTAAAGGVWTHIPHLELEALSAAFSDWENVYRDSLTSGVVSAPVRRRSARKKAEEVIRPFVRRHLHFKDVSDGERVDMGIPNYQKGRRQKAAVTEEVLCVLVTSAPRIVEAHFRVLGAGGKGKPLNYDGAVVLWDTLEDEPKQLSDLTHQALAARTPFTLTFGEEDRGKKLYMALAWQNSRGMVGNWGNILSTYIP